VALAILWVPSSLSATERQARGVSISSHQPPATVAHQPPLAHDRDVQLFSLYLHIPYCDSKCPYCDFNSYAVKRWPERAYCEALVAEMTAYAAEPVWRDGLVQTIFLGGGTPSLFSAESIGGLLEATRRLWRYAARRIEITMEANPGTVDAAKLRDFASTGVNRISFGVQSFHPRQLAQLGRIHSAGEAIAALGAAQAAGFDDVNLDLMFAVPGQTPDEWEDDLATAVRLQPNHISAYSLTYEDGTAFGAWRRSGALLPVAEEADVAMFTRTQSLLRSAGYAQYEISNYAQAGRECAHNLNYWRAGPYLGVGAGAHSFSRHPEPGRRWANEKSPGLYMERVAETGDARVSDELLSVAQARGEFVFLNLRCRDGFESAAFERRFGTAVGRAFPHVETFVRDGFLACTDGRWRLSDRGLLVADSIFATFL
jgi:oxygen-independent coproporphyrinogen-3 oxidase